MQMTIIAGLGNPGQEYEHTRHNSGREIAQEIRKAWDFPDFRFEKKWNAEISEGKVSKVKTAILLPNTFMNKSGGAVSAVLRFYKVKPKDLFVIHDDADILVGSAKLSFNKRSAGHKGIESVMRALKTREFWRFRIGIGGKRDIPAEKVVLRKWTPDEKRTITKIIKRTIKAAEIAITEGPDRAMNTYNQAKILNLKSQHKAPNQLLNIQTIQPYLLLDD